MNRNGHSLVGLIQIVPKVYALYMCITLNCFSIIFYFLKILLCTTNPTWIYKNVKKIDLEF